MNIAILGLGTIGSGVYELVKGNPDINVKKILDIKAWMDIMTTSIDDIVNDKEIDIVVETMGGLHPAREFALKCIEAGKSYITANKFLVSEYAVELSEAAKKANVSFMFSAACGGGIPYLYNLSKMRSIDNIVEAGGILNGTTNFILDKIFSEGEDYASALATAQQLGYAEKDPSSDVDGLDTQRKLTLACAVAYGKLPKPADIPTFGIRNISKDDIKYANELGCVVRLMATSSNTETAVEASVMPVICSAGSLESGIKLNVNYAWYKGERIGHFAYTGQGAGKFPTAGNILRDIYAIIGGENKLLPESFGATKVTAFSENRYYVRFESAYGDAVNGIAEKRISETAVETKSVSLNELLKLFETNKPAFVARINL